MSYELLHSKAYESLQYGPAIKLLCFLHEKIRLEKLTGKKGKTRFQLKDNGHFSFTYKEGNHRGLSDQQFSKALRELHQAGFLDVYRAGSALKGDFSVYLLSDRWRLFGQPGFEKKEFPKSLYRIEAGFQVGHDLLQQRERAKAKKKKLTMRIHS